MHVLSSLTDRGSRIRIEARVRTIKMRRELTGTLHVALGNGVGVIYGIYFECATSSLCPDDRKFSMHTRAQTRSKYINTHTRARSITHTRTHTHTFLTFPIRHAGMSRIRCFEPYYTPQKSAYVLYST
jgi:hypothetical protein